MPKEQTPTTILKANVFVCLAYILVAALAWVITGQEAVAAIICISASVIHLLTNSLVILGILIKQPPRAGMQVIACLISMAGIMLIGLSTCFAFS